MRVRPAFVVRHFTDPLEVHGGSPMTSAYLHCSTTKRIPHTIQAGLLWGGGGGVESPRSRGDSECHARPILPS
jgi:hypothetical protein